MDWNRFARDYLDFSRKDRIGVLALLILMVILIAIPGVIQHYSPADTVKNDTSWISALKKLELQDTNSLAPGYAYERTAKYRENNSGNNYRAAGMFFPFDPNTLSFEGWIKLGVREKTIQTIQNYLNKGGRFRKQQDLQRIYGLHPELYERIAPYIRIATLDTEISLYPEYRPPISRTKSYTIIDVNTADTSAFIELPGIGNKLAGRIVNFREKLGGFHLIEQVAETFGLPDSTFQKIKPYLKLEFSNIRKININTATLEELKSHPYIRYSIANPFVAYRNEHGRFLKMEDIKNVMVVTDEIYKKIVPYLTLNNGEKK